MGRSPSPKPGKVCETQKPPQGGATEVAPFLGYLRWALTGHGRAPAAREHRHESGHGRHQRAGNPSWAAGRLANLAAPQARPQAAQPSGELRLQVPAGDSEWKTLSLASIFTPTDRRGDPSACNNSTLHPQHHHHQAQVTEANHDHTRAAQLKSSFLCAQRVS